MSSNQIKTIFEEQKHITNIDSAFDIITLNDKFKSSKLEVIELQHPDDITLTIELILEKINGK